MPILMQAWGTIKYDEIMDVETLGNWLAVWSYLCPRVEI